MLSEANCKAWATAQQPPAHIASFDRVGRCEFPEHVTYRLLTLATLDDFSPDSALEGEKRSPQCLPVNAEQLREILVGPRFQGDPLREDGGRHLDVPKRRIQHIQGSLAALGEGLESLSKGANRHANSPLLFRHRDAGMVCVVHVPRSRRPMRAAPSST